MPDFFSGPMLPLNLAATQPATILHKAIDKLVKAGKIKEEDLEIVFRGYMIYPDLPGGSTDVKVGGEHPALWQSYLVSPISSVSRLTSAA